MIFSYLSYSKKLFLLILLVSLVPIIAFSVIVYVDKTETETNSLKSQLNSISKVGSQNVYNWLNEKKISVFAVAQDDDVVSSTKKLLDPDINKIQYFDSRFELENELSIFLETFPDIQNFMISDAKTGKVIFYTDLIPPTDLTNQIHFQQAASGKIVQSDVFLSSTALPNEFGDYDIGVPTFLISAPIRGEEGIEGVLTARIDLFKINSLNEITKDFSTVDAYLINSDGYFISKPNSIGEVIKYGLIEKRPELELQVINPNSNQFTELFQMASSDNTELNLNGYTNYLGISVIGSISPIKETNWSYIVEVQKNEAFIGIVSVQILIFSLISIVLVAIFGSSFYFASSLTSPIKKLQNASEQITQGNLSVQTAIDSNDEIGELSRSFEYMVENLKKMTDIESQLVVQENLRKALDESSIVSILDHDGIITHVNDNFCRVSKYTKDELIGKHQNILRAGVHPHGFYSSLWNQIKNGKVWNGEVCNKAKDGTLFWNKTTIIPFLDKNGKISEYVAVRSDITEQKRLSKKLISAERLTAIGELSARISHDIRNPLTTLNNEFEILKRSNILDEKQNKRIDNSMKRITHQIDEVLEFVRETKLHESRFNISQTLQNVIDDFEIPSNVSITTTDNPVFMIGDEKKMEIVLINLIYNSLQAINNDGTIDIKIQETDVQVIIEIKDSGAGISITPIELVFDPLITSKQKGTGLGLASVKNIVEQHNGLVTVKNNPTTFTVIIPKKEQ